MQLTPAAALAIWRGAIVESVRRETPDLSARQMAVLLSVHLGQPPHTVRGLARALGVSKPAITRALDRLSKLRLVRRAPDETDRRSVLVELTDFGAAYVGAFAELIVAAAADGAEARPAARAASGD